MKIYDLTPIIQKELAVFPGDIPFSRSISMEFPHQHLTLSSMQSTLHIGAHADASIHYNPKGKGIEAHSLEPYLGECQVISVNLLPGERIYPSHIKDKITAPRVLIHTGSFPEPNNWNEDFNSLSPELVHFLADHNVILVGIDTPSVDPASAKELKSHQALYERKLFVLEGLLLSQVPVGNYFLIALPLPILGADASPVRAILLENS